MAIGPDVYREKYKNYSIDELKTTLKELKKARQEEKEIDDNNVEIKVVKDLINCKSKKIYIRKTKLDENGMEYEVEEYAEMPNIEEDAKNFRPHWVNSKNIKK